jgi:hypothetical protein
MGHRLNWMNTTKRWLIIVELSRPFRELMRELTCFYGKRNSCILIEVSRIVKLATMHTHT